MTSGRGTGTGDQAVNSPSLEECEWQVETDSSIDPFVIVVPGKWMDETTQGSRNRDLPEYVWIEVDSERIKPVLRVVADIANAGGAVTVSSDWKAMIGDSAQLRKASESDFRRFRFRHRPDFRADLLAVIPGGIAAIVGTLLTVGKFWQWPAPASTTELVILHVVGIVAALGAGGASLAKSYFAPISRR
jgi:hypothetical protein